MEKLAIVIPVYNEQGAIGGVLQKWLKMLDEIKVHYVIFALNDGSKDNSLEILRNYSARFPDRIIAIDKLNSGHGPTILMGYRKAAQEGYDWVFQIDSDDEMGPEEFPVLWGKRNEFDFLVGYRKGRRQAFSRRMVSWVSRCVVRLFYGKTIWDVNTPYRLMRVSWFAKTVMSRPDQTCAPNVIISGVASRAGCRRLEIPVPQHDRVTGVVSIKKWKLLKAAFRSFVQTILFSFKAPK